MTDYCADEVTAAIVAMGGACYVEQTGGGCDWLTVTVVPGAPSGRFIGLGWLLAEYDDGDFPEYDGLDAFTLTRDADRGPATGDYLGGCVYLGEAPAGRVLSLYDGRSMAELRPVRIGADGVAAALRVLFSQASAMAADAFVACY